MTCNEGEILSPTTQILGRAVRRGSLKPGQMIYVPTGWAFTVRIPEAEGKPPPVTVAEGRLVSEGIEEAVASAGEQEIHGLKKSLEQDHYILWRRLTEILKQRKRK